MSEYSDWGRAAVPLRLSTHPDPTPPCRSRPVGVRRVDEAVGLRVRIRFRVRVRFRLRARVRSGSG